MGIACDFEKEKLIMGFIYNDEKLYEKAIQQGKLKRYEK